MLSSSAASCELMVPPLLTGGVLPVTNRDMIKRFVSMLILGICVGMSVLPARAAWQNLREDIVKGGSITVMIMTDGTPVTPLHGTETIPTLVVRCYEDTTSIYVRWDGSIQADHTSVRYRIDGGRERSDTWTLSPSHTATGLFTGASSIPLIKSLIGHRKFTLVLAPDSAAPVSTTFALDDMDLAIKPVRDACRW